MDTDLYKFGQMRNLLCILGLILLGGLSTFFPSGASEGQSIYTEDVRLVIDIGQASYQGSLNELYIIIDKTGGRNPLQKAKALTNTSGQIWEISLPLTEGDYIYVFVANPRQYIDLNDANLNPDDVPDANFFNDPNPRYDGFGGQFGKDNLYFVRNPLRPEFDKVTATPLPGQLLSTGALEVQVQVSLGNTQVPLEESSVKARIEQEEPYGVLEGPLQRTAITFEDATQVTLSGRTLSARFDSPPEGLHYVQLDVSDSNGLAADSLRIPIYVNKQNQAPIANAGPTRFGVRNRWVELDGGLSEDPDQIGFSQFQWRKIDGPGQMQIRSISQEPTNGNTSQRRLDGIPITDADGHLVADNLATINALPQTSFDQAGTYEIGLTVSDEANAVSQEARTQVLIANALAPEWKIKVHAGKRNGRLFLTAAASELPINETVHFIADARTPLEFIADANGRDVSADLPAPGQYFIHAYGGDLTTTASHPTELIVQVSDDGEVTARDLNSTPSFWQNDAVMYLLFVREFQDSDGDGEGDFRGATQRIPWMKELGINTIWVMPIEPSGTTHGYSMDSFFAVHEDYGDVEDFERFVERAHDAGIRVVLDFVLNHTSPVHPWFEAAKSNPNGASRDRFLFRPDGSYQYSFDFISLPDLNYNNPIVRKAAVDRAKFWMARGIDGFRCDIAGFTPMSLWRDVRREVLSAKLDGFMLTEIIPPSSDFLDRQFDALYDAWTYWEMRDGFAGNKEFSSLNTAIRAAERFVQDSPSQLVREKVSPEDLTHIRYLGNQDEDRFLLLAGRSKERQRVAAAVLLNLPGMPLITYGDEVGLVEGRGRMRFGGDELMLEHYRKYLRIRNGNPGLRGQSQDNPGGSNNSYVRISSDGDLNADQIFSFLRYGHGQTFVVLANRGQAPIIGTPVQYYLSAEALSAFPDGPLVMTNHAQASDILNVSKSQLMNGHTARVGSHEVKVYQVATVAIPDDDQDEILDSYDQCLGVPNNVNTDSDFDLVPDICDQCPGSAPHLDVGVDGCVRSSSAAKPKYKLDGLVDDEAYLVAQNVDLKLYASFNGRELYLAMSSAKLGEDHVLFVDDQGLEASELSNAPFDKQGQTVARWALLDQGRSDVLQWTGPWVASPAASSSPLQSGVVETTINLIERYGSEIPEFIHVTGTRYASGNNGVLLSQVPSATTADSIVSFDELLQIRLKAPLVQPYSPAEGSDGGITIPTQDGGNFVGADSDGDSIKDSEDNCPGVVNRAQIDQDSDGRGDLCDACPLSLPNQAIDHQGCAAGETPLIQATSDSASDKIVKHRCDCRATDTFGKNNRWIGLFMLLTGLFRLTRPHGFRKRGP